VLVLKAEPITLATWLAQGEALFGTEPLDWKFVCPCCGNVQTMREFKVLKVEDVQQAYSSCIGRFDGVHGSVNMGTKPGPCNYAGFGLFGLNPVAVIHPETGKQVDVFAFAGSA